MLFTISAEMLDKKYITDGTDTLSGVLEVISDLLLHPCFADDSFDQNIVVQEKNILIDDIKAKKNNTRVYSVTRCIELMRDGKLNAPTYEESLSIAQDITTEDLRAFYKTLVAAPPDVFYIGTEQPSAVENKLCTAFAEQDPKPRHKIIPIEPYGRAEYVSKKERMPVAQGKLSMGFSTGTCITKFKKDHYIALVFNELFGGSPSSKLFLNVREAMSLCYYCSSSFSIYSGTMTVSCGIKVTDLDKARTAILDQLKDMKDGSISEQEMVAAKLSVVNSYRQIYDNPFDIQAFYSGRQLLGIGETLEDCINGITAVTAEEVIAFAQRVKLDAQFFVEGTLSDKEDENDDQP